MKPGCQPAPASPGRIPRGWRHRRRDRLVRPQQRGPSTQQVGPEQPAVRGTMRCLVGEAILMHRTTPGRTPSLRAGSLTASPPACAGPWNQRNGLRAGPWNQQRPQQRPASQQRPQPNEREKKREDRVTSRTALPFASWQQLQRAGEMISPARCLSAPVPLAQSLLALSTARPTPSAKPCATHFFRCFSRAPHRIFFTSLPPFAHSSRDGPISTLFDLRLESVRGSVERVHGISTKGDGMVGKRISRR